MLIENIFHSLLTSSKFYGIVNPHLSERYFSDTEHNIVYKKIKEYSETKFVVGMIDRISKQPTISDIKLLIDTDNNITESDTRLCYDFLDSLKNIEAVDDEKLLIKQTENFCQNRALEIAILDSVEIIQDPTKAKGGIEDKIKAALAVEFDVKIGMDFFSDAPLRYDKYIEEEDCISTGLETMDLALNGGWRRKSIHLFLAGTNVGKTLVKCHFAAAALERGLNVLYISGEMSEDAISKRIDANLLDMPVNDFNKNLDKTVYLSKIKKIYDKTKGKLVVKEYPTGHANANHIRNLLNELKQKRGFVPDVVFLDYLNIFSSCRLKSDAAIQSYQYIKHVIEEMRALATEFNFALVSSTQTNRQGQKAGADTNMTNTSDSHGTNMTADAIIALISSEELFAAHKFILKILKSRFLDNINACYTIGVDRPKMRLVDLPPEEQEIPIHVKDALKDKYNTDSANNALDTLDFS